MERYRAFSLAEALITLLIVCIVAIASAPILTKKARKAPAVILWQTDTIAKHALTPTGMQDLRLGTDVKNKEQGIVVVGKLYFQDRHGNTIGWLAEDGTTSFAQGNDYDFDAMARKQAALEQMLNTLTQMLQQELAKQQNESQNLSKRNTPLRANNKINRNRNTNNTDSYNINAQQIDNEELQKQLEALLNAIQTENNR